MKTFSTLALYLCLFCVAVLAQTPTPDTNIFGAGVTYNASFAGTGLYARLVATDTYAFTVVDAIPTSAKPVTIETGISVGVARRILTIGNVKLFVPTAAGPSFTGKNTGWNWSTGLLGSIPIGSTGFRVMPNVRLQKSSISDSGYVVMGGFMLGWGN